MNTFGILAARARKKLAKLTKRTIYYKSRYGLKQAAGRTPAQTASRFPAGAEEWLDADELYLGVDALFDPYTHAGKPLTASPHVGLMRAMDTGETDGCEYLLLERQGRLDSRDGFVRTVGQHAEAFARACKALEDGTDAPVQYYVADGKKYLHDGKHRAALRAYRGEPVRAVRIPPAAVYTPFIGRILRACRKTPEKLSKNYPLVAAIAEDYERRRAHEQEL